MNKYFFLFLLLLTSRLFAFDPVIILVGPPGAGKGTFADLAVKYGYNHISAGDLIRDEIKNQTPFGKDIEEIVRQGDYVDPDTLFMLIRSRIIHFQSESKPFIIDGYGRTEHDVQALCNLLIEQNLQDKTFVLWLEADDEICKARIPTRVVCSDCHHVYSTLLDPTTSNTRCLFCPQGLVEARLNDTPDVIEKRILKYRDEIVYNYKKTETYFPSLTYKTNSHRTECLAFYEKLLRDIASFDGTSGEFILLGAAQETGLCGRGFLGLGCWR